MYNFPIIKDFVVEYDLIIGSPKPKNKYGVIFRSDDVPGGLDYYYRISLKPIDKVIELTVWDDNEWVRVDESDIPKQYLNSGETTRIRMEILDNTFKVFLDGEFVHEFNDDILPSAGILGISLGSYDAPETFEYDNLQVFKISP